MSNVHNEQWLETAQEQYAQARRDHDYRNCLKVIRRLRRAGFRGEAEYMWENMFKHRREWWKKQGLCQNCGGRVIAGEDCPHE